MPREVVVMSEEAAAANVAKTSPAELRGWLLKWTNYFRGYQKRWFVLSGGVFSYYRWATMYCDNWYINFIPPS